MSTYVELSRSSLVGGIHDEGKDARRRVKRNWQANYGPCVLGDGLLFRSSEKTVASSSSGGTEFGEKVEACAEQNISATQEFVRDLSYAKDFQDVLRIQMEFMRSQLEAFGEQAKDLSEAYIKAASGQMRTPSP